MGVPILDKTFVDRPPAAFVLSADIGDDGVPLHGPRPTVGQTRIGHSLVTDVIGEGGMATIYKVWNERLETIRVVKLLLHDTLYARFETEAKITAKLHHSGIIAIYYADEWNGTPYMEMEFIDGSNLQQWLAERGNLPEIVCVAIAVVVADALAHAHTQTFSLHGKRYHGIVHRDLKPANVMISKDGAIKLIDFGVACPTRTSLHTAEGNIDGTLQYISPEQMKGDAVDNRSDIYSFGAILYEMLTGSKTFPQESVAELLKLKTANRFKSPYDYGIPVNADFVNIIHRCLKSVPAKRYQNAHDLVDDLQKLNKSMTNLSPEDVLKDYFYGTGDAILTCPGKAKARWFPNKPASIWPFGKPTAPKQADKSKLPEASDKSMTPELSEKPINGTSASKSDDTGHPHNATTDNNVKIVKSDDKKPQADTPSDKYINMTKRLVKKVGGLFRFRN